MIFKYPEGSLELSRAQVEAIHPDAKLYYDNEEGADIQRFELSLPSVNYILSGRYAGPRSGFALGKLYNFYGFQSTGKSAMAMQITGDIIKQGGRGAWTDVERSWDNDYTKEAYGLDEKEPDKFILFKPDYGEQAFDIIHTYASNGSISINTCDSVSALGTQRTNEANALKNDVAHLSLRLSQHLPRVIKSASDNFCSIVYINQMRDKLVTVGGMMMAAGKKFTGGNAMLFYPHVAIEFSKVKDIYTANEDFVGVEVELDVTKNKVGKPHLKTTLLLIPGEGFSREADILRLAVQEKVCEKKGNWFFYGEQGIGNGVNMARLKLKEKPEFLEEIWNKTKLAMYPVIDISTGEILPAKEVTKPIPVKKSKSKKAAAF